MCPFLYIQIPSLKFQKHTGKILFQERIHGTFKSAKNKYTLWKSVIIR
jgi:hypothetical protein